MNNAMDPERVFQHRKRQVLEMRIITTRHQCRTGWFMTGQRGTNDTAEVRMIQKFTGMGRIGPRTIEQEWSRTKLNMVVVISMILQARRRMHMEDIQRPHLVGRWNPILKGESSILSVGLSTLATSWKSVAMSMKTVRDRTRINSPPTNINRILDRRHHRLPTFETLLWNHLLSTVSELVGHVRNEGMKLRGLDRASSRR